MARSGSGARHGGAAERRPEQAGATADEGWEVGGSTADDGPARPLPDDVRTLIMHAIETVAHLDALLALHRARPAQCTLAELAAAAQLPSGPVARRCADDLIEAGLASSPADAPTYRYATSPALLATVTALAAACEAQRPLVLRAIYRTGGTRRGEPRARGIPREVPPANRAQWPARGAR